MSSNPFIMGITMFYVAEKECIRAGNMEETVVIYRVPYACAKILNSRRKSLNTQQYEEFQDELKNAGTYILIDTATHSVYTGKAESRKDGTGVLRRMLDAHDRQKDPVTWDIGFVLTSDKKDYFSSDDLKYLEKFFYNEAKKNRRYDVQNIQDPSKPQGKITFSMKAKLKAYSNDALRMLSFKVGCDVFERNMKDTNGDSPSEHRETGVQKAGKKRAASPQNKNGSLKKQSNAADRKLVPAEQRLVLALKGPQVDADATGEMIDNRQIIVKAGSRVSKENKLSNQSGCRGVYEKRIELEKSGIIHNRVFTEDCVFPSKSNAAKIVLGSSASGNRWKMKEATCD